MSMSIPSNARHHHSSKPGIGYNLTRLKRRVEILPENYSLYARNECPRVLGVDGQPGRYVVRRTPRPRILEH